MNLRNSFLCSVAVVAMFGTAAEAQAATISATFTKGAVAEYDKNANQTNNAQLLSTLGIKSITISQVTNDGTWGGSQGNDTNVSVSIKLTNGTVLPTFTAAINWLQKTGNKADWIGLTIAPGVAVADGYPLTATFFKTYLLEFSHSTLVETLIVDPNALDGSADTKGALAALNALVPADTTAPVITPGQILSYAENRVAGNTVGTVAATDANGVVTYSFANGAQTTTDGFYTISDSGVISITAAGVASAANNDFETLPNTFTYGIVATDAAGNASAATNVTLALTDIDETAPVITGPSGGAGAATAEITVNENQTVVTTPTVTGATTAVWSISGGVDAAKFTIDPATGAISFVAAPDFEAPTDSALNGTNTYELIVQVLDTATNKTSTQTITVRVADLGTSFTNTNSVVNSKAAYTYEYNEKSTTTAVLGTVSTSATSTFAITGGDPNGWFAINNSGQITLTTLGAASVANDYLALDNSHQLQIQATSGGETSTIAVVLNEVDNAPPILTGPSGAAGAATSQNSVPENQLNAATMTANEPISTWEIVQTGDGLLFSIDANGKITFNTAPNYEKPTDANTDNAYVITVKATDAAGKTSTQEVTINVTDVNDGPVFTNTTTDGNGNAIYRYTYNEKSADADLLGTVTATGTGTLTFSIDSGTDANLYEINSSTGAISLSAAGVTSAANDFLVLGNSRTIKVKVTTSGNETALIDVVLTEQDNAGPIITGPTNGPGAAASGITVDENQTAVTQLVANEPVAEWKIVGGDDAGAFSIAADGTITFLAPPNYEKPTDTGANNTYVLTVQAKDAAGKISTQTVTVTIRDLNDAPVFTDTVKDENGNDIYSFDYKEKTLKSVTLGSTPATGAGTLTYSIVGGNDNNWYAINSATGAISLTELGAASLANDFETLANRQILEVQAANTFGDSTKISVRLNELDIDDTPPLITGPSGGAGATASAITINEGLTAVTKMTANESIKTWELSGPDAAKLSIAADGTITFKEAPDYENPTDADKNNTYVVIIKAIDQFGNESVQTLTITIGNVDEIAQKLREIGGKLRSDLRNYAFKSMQDMLSFNEGLMQGSSDDDADCAAAATKKAMSGSVNANQDQQALSLNYAKQLNACGSRIRVLLDMGLASSRMDGNTTLRTLGSIRAERNIAQNVTVGLGVMGSFASDRMNSFADSHISDESFQVNGYIRSRLSDELRVAAFGSVGQSRYKFRLNDDGFALTGRMKGDRVAYGMMLTGDFAVAGMTVTTDVALSRASESLGDAKLSARYKGESRSGIAFGVGSVDATRLSVPVHLPLLGRKTGNAKSESTQLSFSPGLLCEDTSADTSRLVCGYQLGGRYRQTLSANDRLTFDVKHEKVEGNQRNLFALGFSHLFGPLELGVALNQEMSRYAADTRALLTVRVTGR